MSTAFNVKARAIIIPTESGRSARLVSNFRPMLPILAVTPHDAATRKMTIYWGVDPVTEGEIGDKRYVVRTALEVAKRRGVVRVGDVAVLTVGDPDTSITFSDGVTSTNVVHVAQVR